MLSIRVSNQRQNARFEHGAGPLEFGRGPKRDARRYVIDDGFVSRDHMIVQEVAEGRLRVTNLSQRQAIDLADKGRVPTGGSFEVRLPVRLPIGNTVVEVNVVVEEPFDRRNYQTIVKPVPPSTPRRRAPTLRDIGDSPSPEKLAHWLEEVVALQQMPGDTLEFYTHTARALVDLVGLDLGLVLLRRGDTWEVAGNHSRGISPADRYSRTLLTTVVEQRRTFYQDAEQPVGPAEGHQPRVVAASLLGVAAVVASPFFGLDGEVAGVLYGERNQSGWRAGIRALEAQVVQLFAAAAGANLARTLATRNRVQFEQFFSPQMVRELERDPRLLEGKKQVVTILVSDLRGSTTITEQLEPETTCRLLREVMERLSDQIVAHGGVIVDYAGDGILAMWNAPQEQPDHAARACRAALGMLSEMPDLSARWLPVLGKPLTLGVGINTGVAQVGNTGCSRMLKYGPHGLTVNLASRVQDATKKLGVPLLLSESVLAHLPNGFSAVHAGTVAFAGLSGEANLFRLTTDSGTLTLSENVQDRPGG